MIRTHAVFCLPPGHDVVVMVSGSVRRCALVGRKARSTTAGPCMIQRRGRSFTNRCRICTVCACSLARSRVEKATRKMRVIDSSLGHVYGSVVLSFCVRASFEIRKKYQAVSGCEPVSCERRFKTRFKLLLFIFIIIITIF